MKILFALLFTLVCGPLRAVDANPFFAMNTIARGGPAEVVPLLKELGYAGLGGAVGDGALRHDAREGEHRKPRVLHLL